jgi:hypothetical protein
MYKGRIIKGRVYGKAGAFSRHVAVSGGIVFRCAPLGPFSGVNFRTTITVVNESIRAFIFRYAAGFVVPAFVLQYIIQR